MIRHTCNGLMGWGTLPSGAVAPSMWWDWMWITYDECFECNNLQSAYIQLVKNTSDMYMFTLTNDSRLMIYIICIQHIKSVKTPWSKIPQKSWKTTLSNILGQGIYMICIEQIQLVKTPQSKIPQKFWKTSLTV